MTFLTAFIIAYATSLIIRKDIVEKLQKKEEKKLLPDEKIITNLDFQKILLPLFSIMVASAIYAFLLLLNNNANFLDIILLILLAVIFFKLPYNFHKTPYLMTNRFIRPMFHNSDAEYKAKEKNILLDNIITEPLPIGEIAEVVFKKEKLIINVLEFKLKNGKSKEISAINNIDTVYRYINR